MKGKVLLYLELILIVLLFYLGNFGNIFEGLISTGIFITGAILIVWSTLTMQVRYFSPFPEPPKKHKLTTKGLYKYMLHPMYTGIILIGFAMVFSSPSLQIFVILFVLTYVLDQKASIEEGFLSKMYPEYSSYRTKTKKFIPFLY